MAFDDRSRNENLESSMPTPIPFSTLRTQIAGVPVSELVRQFGTPAYVYDAARILERINDLRAFDTIRFAQKACSNLAILDLMRQSGVLVDAVSAGEIRRALAAGFSLEGDPPPIVYTADVFDREVLDVLGHHPLHVNCGSPDMIDQLGELKGPKVSQLTLRLNPGFGHGHSRKTNTGGEQSKHGIWYEQLRDCLGRARGHGLRVTGLHMHIGSGTDLEHLRQVCGAMLQAALLVGDGLEAISAGGGLPVPYRDGDSYVDLSAYYSLWDGVRRKLADSLGHKVRLEIEPGRYLVAESGYLISEIRAVKQSGKNTFYLVDAGFNNLIRPSMYGAYHPISVVPKSGKPESRLEQDVVVGGPLCESGDIFTQEEGGVVCTRRLPVAQVGDFIVLEVAGAYGFVMGSNYNSKPLAPEILVSDGKPHLVRARQTFDDLIRGESIPGAR
jgi:diaminopimelate decarboxylase